MKIISVGNFETSYIHYVNGYALVITTKARNDKAFKLDGVLSVYSSDIGLSMFTGQQAINFLKLLGVTNA